MVGSVLSPGREPRVYSQMPDLIFIEINNNEQLACFARGRFAEKTRDSRVTVIILIRPNPELNYSFYPFNTIQQLSETGPKALAFPRGSPYVCVIQIVLIFIWSLVNSIALDRTT